MIISNVNRGHIRTDLKDKALGDAHKALHFTHFRLRKVHEQKHKKTNRQWALF